MNSISLSELTDLELVLHCQEYGSNDDRPFQELMRRYQTLIWRICYSSLHNPQDAEDLTQEVFLKVYRNLAGFEGRSSFKTWIYRIAINTCRNEIRHRKRRPQEAASAIEDMADMLPAVSTTVTDWQAQVQREQLAMALHSLRPEEYEILQLKDIEERPYTDITSKLGISLSAAKMRAQRARQALQVQYLQMTGEAYAI
ncbi:MAG: sigma-70 family RNA polymerase sigma factor [Ardenticatenaceae bacterium]|nr:sigma-70 family RNA polymerase sigma factor [Ardenticatenaceae bacterium]